MSLSERLALIVDLDAKGAIKGLTKIGETAEKQLGKAEGRAAKFGKTLTKVGIGAIGTGAVIGAAMFKAAEAFDHAELATIKLDNSIANSGKVAESSKAGFIHLATAIQNKTAADDNDIIAGEAVLVQMGATAAQVQKLTPLIVDLSRKKGIDLVKASQLVGKALNGNAGALSKQGVIIDKVAFATDRYAAINDALRHSVGGFAEEEGKTFAGSLERLKNQLKDVEEGVGKGAVQAFSKLLDPVSKLAVKFGELDPNIQSTIGEVATFGAVGLIAAGSALILVGKVVQLREKFLALSATAPRTAASISAIAKAAALFAAVKVGVTLGNALNQLPKPSSISALSDSLLDFTKNGRATGEVSKLLGGDLGKLNHAIEDIAKPSNVARFSNALEAPRGLAGANTNLDHAHASIKALDEGLTDIARHNPDDAAASLAAIHREIGDKNFDRLVPLLHGYKEELAGLSVNTRTTADGTFDLVTGTDKFGRSAEEAAQAAKDQADALKAINDAIDGVITKYLSFEDKQDAFQSGLNNLADDVKGIAEKHLSLKGALGGTDDAYLKLREDMRSVVDKGADIIENMVSQGRGADEINAKVLELSRSFEKQAKAAGVPQAVIDHYLAVLRAIPIQPIITPVDVDTNDAEAKIARLAANIKALRLGTPIAGPGSASPNQNILTGKGVAGDVAPVPKRASGGPVRGHAAYLIGEEGPELFVPAGSGYIIPNNRLRDSTPAGRGGAATPTSIVNHWSIVMGADSAANPRAAARRIVEGLRAEIRYQGGDVQKVLGAA